MTHMGGESREEYLKAFLDGYEFVLLALEGRLDLVDEATAEDLAPFLEDYRRLADLLRERGIAPRPRVRPRGPVFRVRELDVAARN